jgi:hypothetical protein
VGELPRRLSVVAPPRDPRVADLLFADRENFFGFLELGAYPAGVLAVEQEVVLSPLRFEL